MFKKILCLVLSVLVIASFASCGKDDTPEVTVSTDNNNPAKLNKINEYLKKLDDEQLNMVENLVKNLAKK